MRARYLVVAVVIISLFAPVVAHATHTRVRDGNDTQGALDVRMARMKRDHPPRFLVRTFSGWSARGIWDRGYILIYFDTFGYLKGRKARFDYYGLIRSNGRSLAGELYRDRRQTRDRRIGRFKARKLDRRTVKATIAVRDKMRIGDNRDRFRWYVKTLYTSRSCKRVCIDRAPDARSVTERLRR